MTPAQERRVINVLAMVADGCNFASSRAFKGGTCAQENGRGYNCTACEARELYRDLTGKEPPP